MGISGYRRSAKKNRIKARRKPSWKKRIIVTTAGFLAAGLIAYGVSQYFKSHSTDKSIAPPVQEEIKPKKKEESSKIYLAKVVKEDINELSGIEAKVIPKTKNKLAEFGIKEYEIKTVGERAKPYFRKIKSLEENLMISGFRNLIGAESAYISKAKSPNVGAYGLSQLTENGVKGLNTTFKRDEWVLSSVLDINKVKNLKMNNYVSDIDEIDLKDLEWKESTYKSIKKEFNIQKEEIRSVMIPRYNKLIKIFPDYRVNLEKTKTDDNYNLEVGAAIHLSDKLELSSLQLIKEQKLVDNEKVDVFRWVFRPRSFFVENQNLQAFQEDDYFGAYNAGKGRTKQFYVQLAKKKMYNTFRTFVQETQTHRDNINRYDVIFKELICRGILS